MSRQRFQRGGRGVFKCKVCGRGTREVNQSNSRLCPECWELAGLENGVLDGGAVEDYAQERDRLVAKAVKQGSSESKIRTEFNRLWN